MTDPFKTYLQAVEQNLKAGNATEHTHRPALKTLLEALSAGITATNEPKHIACGAPDFIVARSGLTIGYIEAKDVGKSLHEAERGEQLKRYRRSLSNLILTDYLPLTSDPDVFRSLCGLGRELVGLHLLESPAVNQRITRFPVANGDEVDKGYPQYLAPGQPEPGTGQPLAQGRVYINKTQYFDGVAPEVWEFQVGGYQVLDKWLKDRRGRKLSYDDLTHYQQVVVALAETTRLMAEIDEAIPGWPVA